MDLVVNDDPDDICHLEEGTEAAYGSLRSEWKEAYPTHWCRVAHDVLAHDIYKRKRQAIVCDTSAWDSMKLQSAELVVRN